MTDDAPEAHVLVIRRLVKQDQTNPVHNELRQLIALLVRFQLRLCDEPAVLLRRMIEIRRPQHDLVSRTHKCLRHQPITLRAETFHGQVIKGIFNPDTHRKWKMENGEW